MELLIFSTVINQKKESSPIKEYNIISSEEGCSVVELQLSPQAPVAFSLQGGRPKQGKLSIKLFSSQVSRGTLCHYYMLITLAVVKTGGQHFPTMLFSIATFLSFFQHPSHPPMDNDCPEAIICDPNVRLRANKFLCIYTSWVSNLKKGDNSLS